MANKGGSSCGVKFHIPGCGSYADWVARAIPFWDFGRIQIFLGRREEIERRAAVCVALPIALRDGWRLGVEEKPITREKQGIEGMSQPPETPTVTTEDFNQQKAPQPKSHSLFQISSSPSRE
jgi:hypothetical protein